MICLSKAIYTLKSSWKLRSTAWRRSQLLNAHSGHDLRNLEQVLFQEEIGAFVQDEKVAAKVEDRILRVESSFMNGTEIIEPVFEWAYGTYDCCYHRIRHKDEDFYRPVPEYTTLAAVSFNQFGKMVPHSDDPIRCLSLFQCMDDNYRYDNLLTFQVLDKATGDAMPGKYAILTRGRWAASPKSPFRLNIRFREISLRKVPADLHGAYATFKYLDNTNSPTLVHNEQVDFLSLVDKSIPVWAGGDGESMAARSPVDEVSGGKSVWSDDHLQDDTGYYASEQSAFSSAVAHPQPLSIAINVSAYSDITFMDEAGMRIMRGCRGGLYVLIRSMEE